MNQNKQKRRPGSGTTSIAAAESERSHETGENGGDGRHRGCTLFWSFHGRTGNGAGIATVLGWRVVTGWNAVRTLRRRLSVAAVWWQTRGDPGMEKVAPAALGFGGDEELALWDVIY
ncbi:hypothetical protein S245_000359 [Arachis hypogaea]